MDQCKTITVIFITAVILQLLLICTELNHDSPGIAALEFTKAYINADKTMEEHLCDTSITVNGVNIVDQYINRLYKQRILCTLIGIFQVFKDLGLGDQIQISIKPYLHFSRSFSGKRSQNYGP